MLHSVFGIWLAISQVIFLVPHKEGCAAITINNEEAPFWKAKSCDDVAHEINRLYFHNHH